MQNFRDNATKRSLDRRAFLGLSGLGVTGVIAAATITGGLSVPPAAEQSTHPGTTEMAHMIQNAAASSVAFTLDEIKELNASASSIQIQGKRLPDGVLALSGIEAPPKV